MYRKRKKKEEKETWDKEKLANHMRDQERTEYFEEPSNITF